MRGNPIPTDRRPSIEEETVRLLGELSDAIANLTDAIDWKAGLSAKDMAKLTEKPWPTDTPSHYGVPVVETSEPIREPIVGDFSLEAWSRPITIEEDGHLDFEGYADMGEVPTVDIRPWARDPIGLRPGCPYCDFGGAA